MSAPARLRVASANVITLPKNHKKYKARKKIVTDLEIGDQALIDCDVVVRIVNKGNCSAVVEDAYHNRTNISFDRLSKLEGETVNEHATNY